ncbi:PREDICTED: cell division control protein 6 homolog [Dufourea novaeangliae]|uniref:Cell division control protein n=1 Tax=Dufourea novaeangliae TaxID=178035 RepID=A0A154P4P3_DUFNO|nr:PREDICTED: cell division control protein 6 homolog [Dufourea novaeangliae]KZC06886.1 Cell division control protein 6 like protein [Dufourea novaeangliae]
MTSIQTTIPFNIRKKCSFYGTKSNVPKQDFTNATARETSYKYTSTVKKVITFSSSESESDSDVENSLVDSNVKICGKGTVARTPRRVRKSSECEEGLGSTPPKQKRIGKQEPFTAPLTPSTLLDKLHLISSPDKEEKLVPKQLFNSEKYRNARKALHSSVPETLPGRESELSQLEKFMEKHLKNGTSASLYISGPPGTGKTACLSKLMLKPEFKTRFKVVYVNCTTMKSAITIYGKIIHELGLTASKSGKNSKTVIEKYLISKHKMLLLILDELDQLESQRQSVLYSIFEWPLIQNSKLLLIGIANALDLTDRILPRLQAKCELKPKLMHFPPYTKQQISNIITERLSDAKVSDLFTGNALQMLAGKVAAVSGDIRRALDISRRVVELAESHKLAQILQPTNNNEINTGSPKKQQFVAEKPVDLKEVITVLNGVYGGSQNIEKEESTFPLQQKLLLCSLLLILNKGRNKDVTVGKLHEVYKKVCKKRNIHAVDCSEFVSLCSLIETRGILKLTTKREPRLSKVNLEWDQEELDAALQDKNMMAEIINDVSCL